MRTSSQPDVATMRCAWGPIPTSRILQIRGSTFVFKTRPLHMNSFGFLDIWTGRQALLTTPYRVSTDNFRCFDHMEWWRCRPLHIVCGLVFSIWSGGASGLVCENQASHDRPGVAGASGRLCSMRLWTLPAPSLPTFCVSRAIVCTSSPSGISL